ncbi:hypothetical protein PPACK8108_LOCUS8983 [Phakopsora pachyrhizi]|uniref:Uncharacterized protein n=1 Tax=Phakopsora pachyrhizi TaxID=170000 RepID=A0AAV0B0A3_PHAPC|nr:hypothetical protein PPACK8108_LOCUS8983 [Phakopsora pachyrhizi]
MSRSESGVPGLLELGIRGEDKGEEGPAWVLGVGVEGEEVGDDTERIGGKVESLIDLGLVEKVDRVGCNLPLLIVLDLFTGWAKSEEDTLEEDEVEEDGDDGAGE